MRPTQDPIVFTARVNKEVGFLLAEKSSTDGSCSPTPSSVTHCVVLKLFVTYLEAFPKISRFWICTPVVRRIDSELLHEFVKKTLEASRLDGSNLMARCKEETSLLDEFSHGNHNNGDEKDDDS
ncbi:unnamed protein product [Eruca vesicaria subsp. sativa]|uniref:Rho-GAP domain-containing protein n=1 Tax=Eruca vesicaria subsp. sativa TaxID=29727 RepID=A0ABC8KMT6_ERUVS|nr:unnamed protein product [Eruca vesicaria subsp. sativa]